MSDLAKLLKGQGIITAEMFYRMPDYPNVLNSFIWQDMDLAPDFPRLFAFIEFWQREIDGKLHSVRFNYRSTLAAPAFRVLKRELLFDVSAKKTRFW